MPGSGVYSHQLVQSSREGRDFIVRYITIDPCGSIGWRHTRNGSNSILPSSPGKIAKTVQLGADRFEHRLLRAHGSDGASRDLSG
jgi:hypothetical protein